MTIRIKKDRIEFDGYTLYETPQGLFLNTNINAACFYDMFQGTVAGIFAGGITPSVTYNTISRMPFAAPAASGTAVGTMTICRYSSSCHSSATHGFVAAGGQNPGFVCTIENFPFTAGFNSTCVGNLGTPATEGYVGTSSSTFGFVSGGGGPQSAITKFPFASGGVATSVGSLTQARDSGSGHSSYTHGYDAGGAPVGPTNNIQKFSFQSDANATNIGTMSPVARRSAGGISSCINGYATGGGYPVKSTITRFPFATDSGGTDISNLATSRERVAGSSSVTHGYSAGGNTSGTASGPFLSNVERFAFSADTSNASVGSLSYASQNIAGMQD
jgi:hypothetical protein